MELRHLHYFIAVAEELNFSRAAERLHIAQPPLSQQIRSLEEELGVQLFNRTKRKVELTNAGNVFLEQVRRIIIDVEIAVKAAQRASRGEIGRLVLGFNSSATYSVLPKILQVFRERYPDVELVLHEMTTSKQLESFEKNQIDVGLLYLPIHDNNLSVQSVLKEPLVLAIPENHPLATQSKISIQNLVDETFILPPPYLGEGLYGQIQRFFEQTNFHPKVIQEVILLQTAVSLVAGNVGVTLVPATVQNLKRAGVIYKSLKETTPEIEIAIAWRRDNASEVLQQFLRVIQSFQN